MDHPVLRAITNFQAEEEKIKFNHDLSDQGKTAAQQNLKVQVGAYSGIALSQLKTDLAHQKKRFQKITDERKALEENAAKAWDFQRLNYEKTAIESQFKLATDLAEAEKLYDQYASSGDRHKARVAAEIGALTVRDRFSSRDSLETNHLTSRMSDDLKKMTTTPELEKNEQEGSQAAKSLIDLTEVVKSAGSFFEGRRTVFSKPGQFSQLLDGISVTFVSRPTATSLGYYHVNVDEGDKE